MNRVAASNFLLSGGKIYRDFPERDYEYLKIEEEYNGHSMDCYYGFAVIINGLFKIVNGGFCAGSVPDHLNNTIFRTNKYKLSFTVPIFSSNKLTL